MRFYTEVKEADGEVSDGLATDLLSLLNSFGQRGVEATAKISGDYLEIAIRIENGESQEYRLLPFLKSDFEKINALYHWVNSLEVSNAVKRDLQKLIKKESYSDLTIGYLKDGELDRYVSKDPETKDYLLRAIKAYAKQLSDLA
jgi:hypothetical protein